MPDENSLEAALAGRYDIQRAVGRGGMATVYLAHDVKHGRQVAIKVLDAELAAAVGPERFLREIRVTATLQHPNLLPLYDSGEAAGFLYYVMPFMDGDSLRARLDRERQLPVDDAVRIATATAHALTYAHARGVVHRDLKPENILFHAGQPVIADFGIALAIAQAGGSRMTKTGISIGTPQYMSPEQAAADPHVDARCDIYALAAVTYEMLVGEPPHTGTTAQAVIARVLSTRPRPVRENRPSVPLHIEAAIARGLEALPADRFSTADEFADALHDRAATVTGIAAPSTREGLRSRSTLVAAVATVAALVAGIGWWSATRPQVHPSTRFWVDPPAGLSLTARASGRRLVLSPDGSSLAFIASEQLFIRRIDQLDLARVAKATPRASLQFSPDGRWVSYFDNGPTKASAIPGEEGAEPVKVTPLKGFATGGWVSPSELVYLAADTLWRVPAAGGTPRQVATRDGALDSTWGGPTVLPDGKTIAFTVRERETASARQGKLALLSIEGGQRRVLELECQGVVGLVDDILVYANDGRLAAVRFDIGQGQIIGQPLELTESPQFSVAGATVSDNGTLAYIAPASTQRRIEFVDAQGTVLDTLPELRTYYSPVWDSAGAHLAMSILERSQQDIWKYEVATRRLTRVSRTGGAVPSWTPDGKRIAFTNNGRAFFVAADGSTEPELIPGTAAVRPPIADISISPDGKYAVARRERQTSEPADAPQVFVIPLAGGPPQAILGGAQNASSPAIAPNGKWIAFSSGETGRHEVYVSQFPSGRGKVPISNDGGTAPRWSPDGHRLMYRHEQEYRSTLLDIGGPMPRVVRTDPLPLGANVAGPSQLVPYDMHPSGKYVAVTRTTGDDARIVVVTNWIAGVRARLANRAR